MTYRLPGSATFQLGAEYRPGSGCWGTVRQGSFARRVRHVQGLLRQRLQVRPRSHLSPAHICHVAEIFRLNSRIGALVTQHNPRLLRTLAQMSIQIKISSPADVIFSSLLQSDYLGTFLALNRSRLGEAQAKVRTWFERRGVYVKPCNAGHFVWVHLGPRVGIETKEQELEVFQKLLDGGLYIVSSQRHLKPSGR